MTFVQIQLARDKKEGSHGNYYNYEFGILRNELSRVESMVHFTEDKLLRTLGDRTNYYVLNIEFKRIS